MKIEVGKIYRNFKGNYYIIEMIAKDSSTLKLRVIYRELYGEGELCDRSIDEFYGDIKDRPDNITKQKLRFEKVTFQKC